MKLSAWIPVVLAASLLCLSCRSTDFSSDKFFSKQLKIACGASSKGEPSHAWEYFSEELATVMRLAKIKNLKFSACEVEKGGRQFELLFRRGSDALSLTCSYGARPDFSKHEIACALPEMDLFPGEDAVSVRSSLDADCREKLQKQKPGTVWFTHCATNADNELEHVKYIMGIVKCSITYQLIGSFELTATCEIQPGLKELFGIAERMNSTRSEL